MRAAAIASTLAFAAGCTSPPPPPGAAGPVEAAQDFSRALSRGDPAAAWALLSRKTQKEADALARAARSTGDAGPEPGRQMLFASALPQGAVEAREVSRSGDEALVEVQAEAGPQGRFHLVREGGVWKIDLELQGR